VNPVIPPPTPVRCDVVKGDGKCFAKRTANGFDCTPRYCTLPGPCTKTVTTVKNEVICECACPKPPPTNQTTNAMEIIVCTDGNPARASVSQTTFAGATAEKEKRHRDFCGSKFGRDLTARAIAQRIVAGRTPVGIGLTSYLHRTHPLVAGPVGLASDYDPIDPRRPVVPPNPEDPKSWKTSKTSQRSWPFVAILAFTCADNILARLEQDTRRLGRGPFKSDGPKSGQAVQMVRDIDPSTRTSVPPGFPNGKWCFVALPDVPNSKGTMNNTWRFRGQAAWSTGSPRSDKDDVQLGLKITSLGQSGMRGKIMGKASILFK
jgi:hypothetical protein